ncbi:MAG: ABC transporter ATP-binding protein, partial [Chloroflexi bacterium]|nr:ABC transporter ATP-binding protein [Chloroflexota bacterium]
MSNHEGNRMGQEHGAILEVQDLKTYFYTQRGVSKAVDGVSLRVAPGETIGVVGESGSGKTVIGLSILRLVDRPGRIVNGKILYQGTDLLKASDREMRELRGRKITMMLQNPFTVLNPLFTVGSQLIDTIRAHSSVSEREARDQGVELLRMVSIPFPERRMQEYPHQFSGGMRQRAMLAMAVFTKPDVLIADEPTASLDVTIQAQILDLLENLQEQVKSAMVVITHDLRVTAELAEEVLVLCGGRVVEQAPKEELFANPVHPYTVALIKTVPSVESLHGVRLQPLKGRPPSPLNPPDGCIFQYRCRYVREVCR